MASAIHHGPPGSYKSLTLVQRRAIDALIEGRVVVTNIRGFTSVDRIADNFPDIKFPDSAALYFVNTDAKEGRDLMARWFHWVPFGTLVLIDEAQRIYPKRRDFKIESLDKPMSPSGFDVEELNILVEDDYTGERYYVQRPDNVNDAFDMQRHFQWDCYLSTPHIDKIIDPIRQVCQSAYRHKSLSGKLPKPIAKLFGFYNTWYEFQHDADNAGKLASQVVGKPRKYTVDERIYKCYMSTATGEHTESKADQNILADPKLRIVGLVLLAVIGHSIYNFINREPPKKPSEMGVSVDSPDTKKPGDTPGASPEKATQPSNSRAVADVSNQQSIPFFDSLGFKLLHVAYQHLDDKQHERLSFVADSKDGLQLIQYQDLKFTGVRASVHGVCSVSLVAPDGSILRLGCGSAVVRGCAASATGSNFAIRRNCSKYGDPKPEPKTHQNALVAQASSLLDQLPE